MAVDKFKFVSPGVQIAEIDNSQVTAVPAGVGPTIIGRFERGPAMRPVRISSFSQFIDIFGNPIAGKVGGDVWRNGNYTSPTYAAYAAQAWLRNTPSLNVIRLLGTENENNTSQGRAGWRTDNFTPATNGGAYGLFLIQSSSANNLGTGSLAAIWYVQTGSMALSGSDLTGSTTSGSNVMLIGTGSTKNEFKLHIYDGTGAQDYVSTFNLNPSSDRYIRKVFNTNPILTNTRITPDASQEIYWLGETFDMSIQNLLDVDNNLLGFIAPLLSASNVGSDFRFGMQPAKTGWVIGQDLGNDTSSYSPAAQPSLFRLVAIDSGEWESKNLKISVYNIKAATNPEYNPYGTFSIAVRRSSDTDANQSIVERYTNLDLNPASENFIAKRIGDKRLDWSDSERRYREVGTYPLNSKVVYVELDSAVELGLVDAAYLPFGFYGPPRFKGFNVNTTITTVPTASFVSNTALRANAGGKLVNVSGRTALTSSFVFPRIPLIASASEAGLSNYTKAHFGIKTTQEGSTTLFDYSYFDMTKPKPLSYNSYEAVDANTEPSFIFTLDDVSGSAAAGSPPVYVSGSRALGTSITAVSGWDSGTGSLLSQGYNKFTMPMIGGFDGVDVSESDPFANANLTAGATETTNYVYNTIRRAIDTCADAETLVTDIISIPGITHEPLTTHLINTCESRADALAIIDLPNVYVPEHETYEASAVDRLGDVTTVANALQARGINSSYGATYFPWVQIRDTVTNRNLLVPSSVVALGAMSYGQATQELWFAPAGFTRGGLSEGRGGLPVIGVSQRLNADERDELYEANINPIASFPAEGIVIFGQKTLQITPSALDRINVRRLVIYLKRQISIIASTILFDQNVSVTWNRFKSQAESFLSSVQTRLGITEYRLILDESTTTPDLVDRNIVYAKIFVKPARAIEYIAIDFVIAGSGASFND
jgi:hypothetical protein